MQRFFITPVIDRGREYFLASFPAERKPWSRRAAGRKQKKFSKREAAESFLQEIKREYFRKGGVTLGFDREAHYDFMRAMEVIADIPHGTLEKGAHLLRMSVSAAGRCGDKHEAAPADRKVELRGRCFLMVQNEAVVRKVSMDQAVEGLLSEVALARAEQAVRQQAHIEEMEYEALKKRNDIDRKKLLELRREDEQRKELGKHEVMYELGRQSVLGPKAASQRRWRSRKRAEKAGEDR
jgi:hypothetical protein